MIDIDEQISRIERLYRQLTGNDPKRSDVPLAPIPNGTNPEEYVREQLRRLDLALNNVVRPTISAAPAVTVLENEEQWMCAIELPGVRKSDLAVELARGSLRVSGVRELPPAAKGLRPVFSDAPSSHFERTIPVNAVLDDSSFEARLENGILLVSCRKAPRKRDVRIEVA